MRTQSRSGLLVVPFLLMPIVVVGLGLGALLLTSTDMTETLGVPRSVDRYLQRDRVAYPVHATLGWGFERLGVPPQAAALQWVKAAFHARSDAQLDQTARGLADALARDGDGARVRATV